MVRLYPVRYRKDQLTHIPEEALLYHLLIGQVANEAIIFRKQGMLALTGVDGQEVIELAGCAIAHLNIKMNGSRLLEAQKLINNVQFKTVRQAVHPHMHNEALNAYKAINRYFGKANPIQRLRNEASFHFDIGLARKTLKRIDASTEMVEYFAETSGNCFYGGGATLAAFELIELSESEMGTGGFNGLFDDIRALTRWFECYSQGFLLASAEYYFGALPAKMELAKVEVDGPDIRTVSIPYFMDDDGVVPEDFD